MGSVPFLRVVSISSSPASYIDRGLQPVYHAFANAVVCNYQLLRNVLRSLPPKRRRTQTTPFFLTFTPFFLFDRLLVAFAFDDCPRF